MTVEEYVRANNIQKFYCESDHTVCWVYGKKQKATTHHPINLCHLAKWEQYASYARFRDREVVKVYKVSKIPYIYTKWTLSELLKEHQKLTGHKYIMPVWYRNDVTNEIEFEQEGIPH
jgi:hypothetical protein